MTLPSTLTTGVPATKRQVAFSVLTLKTGRPPDQPQQQHDTDGQRGTHPRSRRRSARRGQRAAIRTSAPAPIPRPGSSTATRVGRRRSRLGAGAAAGSDAGRRPADVRSTSCWPGWDGSGPNCRHHGLPGLKNGFSASATSPGSDTAAPAPSPSSSPPPPPAPPAPPDAPGSAARVHRVVRLESSQRLSPRNGGPPVSR